VTSFEPALGRAMPAYRAEISAIKANAEPATFDDTLAALEDAGRPFGRVTTLMDVFTSTMNDAAMKEVEKRTAPILAAFHDEILHDEGLFSRIKAVRTIGNANLTPEQARLVDVNYRKFARHGAALGAPQKRRREEINT